MPLHAPVVNPLVTNIDRKACYIQLEPYCRVVLYYTGIMWYYTTCVVLYITILPCSITLYGTELPWVQILKAALCLGFRG